MTKPDLAALSDAATQGSWHVAAYYHNSGTPDERCGGFIEADDSPTGVIDENWAPDGESLSYDLDFIVALVNAYRSGDLVLIDREGMRDKSATSIHGVLSRANVTAYLDMPVETAGWCADASIAAILGEG